jgi:hypothetical protein
MSELDHVYHVTAAEALYHADLIPLVLLPQPAPVELVARAQIVQQVIDDY